MKKILQINTVVNSGSTGRITEEIGQLAIKAGWKSYIAYGRNERPSKSELIKVGNEWDNKIHGLQTRLFDRHGLASTKSTNNFIEQIEKIKPDIIHLHNIHGYFLNYEILFSFLNVVNIPVVWTLHDCWPITGHCTYFTYVGCDKWETECFSCPQKTKYPASILIDRSKKNFNRKKKLFNSLTDVTMVPVSNWMSEILKQSFLNKYPVKVIHNGINTDVFKPISETEFRSKYGLEEKFVILGVANMWDERKGMRDFIELSKILDSNFQIVLVGLTKKQIEKLPKNILGIGFTNSVEELVEIYSVSNVFINPTYEDNFPTTNLESLACGTPVITYNVGGSPEAVDEMTGIVLEKGNINQLVKAIMQIKQKGKNFYSEACVKRAQRLYKKEDRFKEYIELYEELIKA